ncbi:DUF1624 domain-containing protein [Vampirovibrio sp.]|uniref:DUF1624 domain-containing protein n=1 Tax=Vampirovibrio sp. TaxID=2717857 RepID=UPI0035944B2F
MQRAHRIYSIDVLRGLVIVLMTVDHAREFFFRTISLGDPMAVAGLPVEVFLTRWMTHFCAPTFVFLAGLSAYLYGQKAGITKADLSSFLLKRASVLILLELTVISFAWTFVLSPLKIYLQVIWAIGVGMVCLAGMIWLPTTVITVLTVLLIAAHPLLNDIRFPVHSAMHALWSVLHQRNLIPVTEALLVRTSYPVLPWIGIMGAGYLSGRIFSPAYPLEKRKRWLVWGGAALLLGYGVLRLCNGYGEASPFVVYAGQPVQTFMSFLNPTKYPPSLLFALMTLGATGLALAWLERPLGALSQVLLQFGRVPMFYYILHLYLLHGAAWLAGLLLGLPPSQKFNVPHVGVVWLIALMALLVAYPMVRWFAAVKAARPRSWLRYI